jgi:hypothetical protein
MDRKTGICRRTVPFSIESHSSQFIYVPRAKYVHFGYALWFMPIILAIWEA